MSAAAARGPSDAACRIAAVILAAGRSQRMEAGNKLLAELAGEPLVRRVARTALEAGLAPVVVVLGHDAGAVRAELEGLGLAFTVNPQFAAGIGTSIAAGIRALVEPVDGAAILLGDMPWIAAGDLRRLTNAFDPARGGGICVPVSGGRRGNPVLWSARYFPELKTLDGDVGGRRLLETHADDVCDVAFDDDAVLRDVDTPEALNAARRGEA